MNQPAQGSLFNNDGLFRREFLQWLEREPWSVLLESILTDGENTRHHLFLRPSKVLRAATLEEVEPLLRDVEHALNDGFHIAGYLSYEAGYAFERVLPAPIPLPIPLIMFGVYEEPVTVHAGTLVTERGEKQLSDIRSEFEAFSPPADNPSSFTPVPAMTENKYRDAASRIHRLIIDGDTYQVNLTFKMRFPFQGSPAVLYDSLRSAQRVPYAAFLNAKEFSALSFSPELFFRIEGESLMLKPMKGTAARGRTTEEDRHQEEWLRASEKNRAENLMIVDLLRNDAGRIAMPGGVQVGRFFDIERYETLYQATSTIHARLRKDVRPSEIFRCLFPCGSVTGAPKIRTMQIIRELEGEPRGIYTGSIGYFSPERKAVFSVAIRTLVIDRRNDQAEFGVGSGIVHDSKPLLEYNECLLKSKFLTERPGQFELIETLRWEHRHGWSILDEHLRRLRQSSEYFGFLYRENDLLDLLNQIGAELGKQGGDFRVRVTLGRTGRMNVTHSPLEGITKPLKVALSPLKTDSHDRFLFHKTTRRDLYERELSRVAGEGFYDVLFCNEKGEVTEGARTNVLIRKGNTLLTPPVTCGLLPGTFRAHLLSSGPTNIVERPFSIDELLTADEVLLCNALRGLINVSLTPRQRSRRRKGVNGNRSLKEHERGQAWLPIG